MNKLNRAIAFSLGILATPQGFADVPISFTDAANDIPYPVTDLQEVSVIVTDDTITAILTVGESLTQLPFNHPNSSSGGIEYSWTVWFDVNQNHKRDNEDFSLAISKIKPVGEVAATQGSLQTEGRKILEHANEQHDGIIETSVAGNTMTLSVNKSAFAGLTAITPTTPFYFETFHHYGGTIGGDTAPDSGWFLEVDEQPQNCNGSPTSPPASGYDAGYEAGISACKALYSPTENAVHFPCVDIPIANGIVRYKVDMKLIPESEPLSFSVTGAEPLQ